MRTFLSFIFALCAVLAALLAVPSLWVSQNVADEDGYVAFAEPLARDAEFQGALADALSETLVQDVGLPEQFQPIASQAISRIAVEVADDPGFVTAWNETQRRSHQAMLGDARDLPAERDASPRFVIDLAPIGGFVIDRVNESLPFTIPSPEQTIIEVNGATNSQALDRIRESPTYARNGLIAVAVAGVLALLFARRRSLAVMGLGLGAVVTAGVLKVAANIVVPAVLDRNTAPSPFAKVLLDVYVDRANDSFGNWLVFLAIGGAVAAVAGGLLRAVSSAR